MNTENIVQIIELLTREALLHRKLIVTAFVIISLTATYVGLKWPKTYMSSSSIYVEYKTTIDPLLEGTAVRTDVADVAANASQIIYGRTTLTKVLEQSGWLSSAVEPEVQEQLVKELKQRVTVSNIGRNMVKIDYRDRDPERAFRTTKILTDLLINEFYSAKTRESQSAFDFIDNEVNKYENILINVDSQITQLRTKNLDAQPEQYNQTQINIGVLSSRIDDIEQELRDAKITQESLNQQLGGEAKAYSTLLNAERTQARIEALEADLYKLQSKYTEVHPDIIQIKQQIADLRKSISPEVVNNGALVDSVSYQMDKNTQAVPLYQNLKQKLYETKTQIITLQARLAEAKRALAGEQERLKRIQTSETEFASLKRDQDIAKEVYQDLLRKREKARVSLSLDTEQANLSIRTVEPAFMPHQPSGLGLVHFAAGGVILGLVLPIALLFGVLKIDQRIRMPGTIVRELELPLIEVIPHLSDSREKRNLFRGVLWSGLAMMLTLVIIFAILWLKFEGKI